MLTVETAARSTPAATRRSRTSDYGPVTSGSWQQPLPRLIARAPGRISWTAPSMPTARRETPCSTCRTNEPLAFAAARKRDGGDAPPDLAKITTIRRDGEFIARVEIGHDEPRHLSERDPARPNLGSSQRRCVSGWNRRPPALHGSGCPSGWVHPGRATPAAQARPQRALVETFGVRSTHDPMGGSGGAYESATPTRSRVSTASTSAPRPDALAIALGGSTLTC